MSPTPTQQAAVTARGNVLLVAGAGTGKTSTLVARCLHCLLEEEPPAALDELLLVTFTDAAAADMRRRIRREFERRLEELRAASPADPDARRREHWLQEQLAGFDTAAIGTLHSFCLNLVREHFHELGLDPQLSVLPEEEGRLLMEETLTELLETHYAGEEPADLAVQELIQTQARGWEVPIRALILKLHHYTQTLRDPTAWLAGQLNRFTTAEPTDWREWWRTGVGEWRDRWRPVLGEEAAAGNDKAAACWNVLDGLPPHPTPEAAAAGLTAVQAADAEWPRGKKTKWRPQLKAFFDEAGFLAAFLPRPGAPEPLAEDWDWVRGQMLALLRLARDFATAYSAAKRELGLVDFHDLEQHTLRVLWEAETGQPTAVAREWRGRLRFVFVDEYQDINEAQDAILQALGREGAAANRFLVGDVKQSIYRFRLADPRIFQNYVGAWAAEAGRVLPLVENFRSREAILAFINPLFRAIMRADLGRVTYDDTAELRFGAPGERAALGRAGHPEPRVELHLCVRSKSAGTAGEAEAEGEGEAEAAGADAAPAPAGLDPAEREARLVARRLRDLRAAGHGIWDEQLGAERPAEWRDMAVLLRSPARKAEGFARAFARLGIPLNVARGGFYSSLEVTDLLSLLQVLDNPRQDTPLLAVLRSPLVGLTVDELAGVRLAAPRGPFWLAVQRFHQAGDPAGAGPKIARFLARHTAWRRLARQGSLSHCLETVLAETHYAAWLLTQPRGEQRQANVRRLLALARQFDRFQRQGLFRFLNFIKAQQETEAEPDAAVVPEENAVSLLSIHASKGLEFPVVVVADLGKEFNLLDLRADIILDEEFGLCPQIKAPGQGTRYPSLPYWLAQRRQRRETLGEELRLLYVALTRARDTLILTGTLKAATFEKNWGAVRPITTPRLAAAKSFLDWLAAWTGESAATLVTAPAGANEWWRWQIHGDDDAGAGNADDDAVPVSAGPGMEPPGPAAWRELQQRLAWRYPHAAATELPAKASATSVSRRLSPAADGEARPLQPIAVASAHFAAPARPGLTAGEIGTAHHTFLQYVDLARAHDPAGLADEAERLTAAGHLTAPEAAALNLPAIARFWQSGLGREIRAHAGEVRRELPFTARFQPAELQGADEPLPDLFAEDFVLIQGVADLVVLQPEEIWLVDFKTDTLPAAELPARTAHYAPQLRLYAAALHRIYRRPVTRAVLYFLARGQAAPVALGAALARAAAPE